MTEGGRTGVSGVRSGEVALVVGATGAIGAAVSRRLVREGASLAVHFRKNQQRATELVADARALGRRALAVGAATEDPASVAQMIATVAAEFGRLDTVVYAAGPSFTPDFISRTPVETFGRVVDADVKGFFHVVQAALPALRLSRGSILAIVTAAVDGAIPLDALSYVPKASVQALVRGIAVEEGRSGVRANCLAPGFIDEGIGKDMVESMPDRHVADLLSRIPLRRIGSVEEVADGAAFLTSARAGYVTGTTLQVSGGMHI